MGMSSQPTNMFTFKLNFVCRQQGEVSNFKLENRVFHYTDDPKPANNNLFFSLLRYIGLHCKWVCFCHCVSESAYVPSANHS